MAGRGPQPKDPSKRARRNGDPVPLRALPLQRASQPDLPECMPNGEPWPEQTRTWWAQWRGSALSVDFTSDDWAELLDTAVLHGSFWSGDLKVASELRLRVAKYGRTPEDRARLRITFATADEADEKRRRPKSSRERYKGLRVAGD